MFWLSKTNSGEAFMKLRRVWKVEHMEALYKFRGYLFRKYVVFFAVLVGGALLTSCLSEVYIANAMLRTSVLVILGLVLAVLASLVVVRELAEVHTGLTEA